MSDSAISQPFQQLIGNEFSKDVLIKLLAREQLSMPLLLHGIEGIGKKRFAREFANSLLSNQNQASCDFMEYFPDSKAGLYSAEYIRQFIRETTLPPLQSKYRVFLLHDIECLTEVTSNSLLKTLEESKKTNIFLLLTSKIEKVLATILSRCQIIPFQPLKQQAVISWLQNNYQLTIEQSRVLAALAEGSLATAERYLNADYQKFLHVINEMLANICQQQDLFSLQQQIYKITQFMNKAHISMQEVLKCALVLLQQKPNYLLLYEKGVKAANLLLNAKEKFFSDKQILENFAIQLQF